MVKIGILFPGQGSQYIGMGKDLYENYPQAKEIFDSANSILGYDLKNIIFEGDEETLKQTQFTQPAIYTMSIAAFNVFSKNFKIDNKNCITAGHSLGEYSALTAADVFSFEDGIKLVKARGQFIQQASELNPGTMAAIIGLERTKVYELCKSASKYGVCEPVNFNSPGQIVIAGTKDAVEYAIKTAKELGALKAIQLNVSGAFHSSLMTKASEMMEEELKNYKFTNPSFGVVTNCDAKIDYSSESIKSKLVKQINNPVLWEDTILNMISWGVDIFIEIGPGKVLTGLLKRIDKSKRCFNIENLENLNTTISALSSI